MSAMGSGLVLRDIHQPPAPSWWPPAPGWWVVGAVFAAAIAAAAWWYWRRNTRRLALARLFDVQVLRTGEPTVQLASMSELLRRAARDIDPAADTLLGDEWLRFLDRGLDEPVFSSGPGRLLRDGGYRPQLAQAEVDAVRPLARARFLSWTAR
ncbi:MAG: DUF4381 family protein [Luteimonas sp.]